MRKYKVSIIVTIILSCLFFTSCASYQKYPSEWAALILPQDQKCLDISGTYMNMGETYLTTLFGFEEAPLAVAQVQIAQKDNDKLEISAWYEQSLFYRKVFSKGNEGYDCSSKGIEIPIVEATGKTILYLSKSKDGALVIERKRSDGGHFLLNVPMVGSSYEWYRFKSAGAMASSGGVDHNIIKQVLGHADIRIPQRYAHVDTLATPGVRHESSTHYSSEDKLRSLIR